MSDEIPALFREFEKSDQPHLGTFWWGRIAVEVPDMYREAAHRLVRTASGGEDAERVLLPVLYIYRHAVETMMKFAIAQSASLLVERGQAEPAAPAALAKRIQRDYRHKVRDLLGLLNDSLADLGMEPVETRAARFLDLLADIDPGGNAFRFAHQLPDIRISLDLPRLLAEFDHAYDALFAVREYLIVQIDDEHEWRQLLEQLLDDEY